MLALGMTAFLMVAAATPGSGGGTDEGGLSGFVGVGLGPGFHLYDDRTSFQFMVRGGVDIPLPAKRLGLSLFLPVRMMTYGDTRGSVRSTTFSYAFVPTVRGNIEIIDKLRAYLDLGGGIAFFTGNTETFFGTAESFTSAAEFDTGVGVDYAVHPNVRIFFEPASFRMFTVGSGTVKAGNFELDVDQDSAAYWTMMAGAHVVF